MRLGNISNNLSELSRGLQDLAQGSHFWSVILLEGQTWESNEKKHQANVADTGRAQAFGAVHALSKSGQNRVSTPTATQKVATDIDRVKKVASDGHFLPTAGITSRP